MIRSPARTLRSSPSAAPRLRRRSSFAWRVRKGRSGYLFILPALAVAIAFLYLPMALSAYWSFTDFNGLAAPNWVGLANYKELLTDPVFLQAVRNTLVFVVIGQGIGPVLGVASALLLNNKLNFRAFFRTAYFVPVMTSLVVVATIWKMLLNSGGIVNSIFGYLHLPTTNWLDNPTTALPSVIAASVWQGFGFETVIFLGAMQAIPPEYYEAAMVDGASAWSRFWHITLPGLRPTILFVYVIGLIQSSQVFDQVFVMTQGGPIGSTDTVVYELVNRFNSLDLGQASAIAYLLAIFLAILSFVQIRVFKEWA
ncbi:MAG TPA: sugar ABC transporter permease [Streptosporangiaceae bacterium]